MKRLMTRAAATMLLPAALILLSAPAVASGGRMTGEAVDRDGNPVVDVEIKMVPSETDLTTVPAKSNKKGKFVIGLLRKSPYRLIASKSGMRVYRAEVHIDELNKEDAFVFEEDVAPGRELPEFNVSTGSEITYKLFLEPSDDDPGEFGTGTPALSTGEIVEMMQAGETKKVRKELKKSLSTAPDNSTYNYLWAFFNLQEKNLDEAIAAIDKTLAQDAAFEGGYLLKGKILEATGDTAGAKTAYDSELFIATDSQVVYDTTVALAVANQKLGNTEESIVAVEKLVELNPDFADGYRILADLYRETGETEKFDEVMKKVAAMGEGDPTIMFNMGAQAYNSGDMENAAVYYQKAIAADADFAEAYRQLAFVLVGTGDKAGAIENLKTYLTKVPEDDPNAASVQAILQQLQK